MLHPSNDVRPHEYFDGDRPTDRYLTELTRSAVKRPDHHTPSAPTCADSLTRDKALDVLDLKSYRDFIDQAA